MTGIVTKYITENRLNNKMSIEEFTQHASEINILLTDKVKRDQARRCLQKGYNFSKKQVFTLIPKLTAGLKKGKAIFHNTSYISNILQEEELVEEGTVNVRQISQKRLLEIWPSVLFRIILVK